MNPHPRPSREIAEAMAYHQDRRTSIYNSLYAAVMGLVPHPTGEHPGYEDIILTRSHRNDIASAPARVAYLNSRRGWQS